MMSFVIKHGKCPLCGTLGENFKLHNYDLKNCPSCGTIFNEFGIIITQEKSEEEMNFN